MTEPYRNEVDTLEARKVSLEGVRIAQCEKNVFNISGMSRVDAESLIHERVEAGKELCLRLYKRPDGTILTDDCPVGLRAKIRWRMQKAILAGGIIAIAAAFAAKYFASNCVATSATSGAMERK